MCKSPKVDTTAQDQAAADAKRAREAERLRQRDIRRGTRDIDRYFDGGRVRIGTKEVIERLERPKIERVVQQPTAASNQQFGRGNGDQNANARPRVTFNVGDKTFDSRDAARTYRQSLPRTKTVIQDVFGRAEGVAPYLSQREDALRSFMFPQLDQQRDDAEENLGYALARAGLTRSSAANERRSDLENEFALAGAKIESDIAADISGQLQLFENQRNALKAELRATGDRSAASESAQRVIQNLTSDAPDLNPLPALFEGVTAGIGTAATGFRNGSLFRQINASSAPARSGRIIGG